MRNPIDLRQRPDSYFRPQALDDFLRERVGNDLLRAHLRQLVDRGQHAQARRLMGDSGLNRAELRMLEGLHPAFMGGNYLPDDEDGSVEIARIAIESTTRDITCVYARMAGARIAYRVVDEYCGDTLSGPRETTSRLPLTLGRLVGFFLRAWPLEKVVDFNFAGDLDGKLGFFEASSNFYWDFDRLCARRVVAHHRRVYGRPLKGKR